MTPIDLDYYLSQSTIHPRDAKLQHQACVPLKESDHSYVCVYIALNCPSIDQFPDLAHLSFSLIVVPIDRFSHGFLFDDADFSKLHKPEPIAQVSILKLFLSDLFF